MYRNDVPVRKIMINIVPVRDIIKTHCYTSVKTLIFSFWFSFIQKKWIFKTCIEAFNISLKHTLQCHTSGSEAVLNSDTSTGGLSMAPGGRDIIQFRKEKLPFLSLKTQNLQSSGGRHAPLNSTL